MKDQKIGGFIILCGLCVCTYALYSIHPVLGVIAEGFLLMLLGTAYGNKPQRNRYTPGG